MDVIYSDLEISMIELLPKTKLHCEVDLEVITADKEVTCGHMHIILHSTIYDIANTPLVSLATKIDFCHQKSNWTASSCAVGKRSEVRTTRLQ